MTTLNLFASCAKYLEGLLAEELAELGADNLKQTVAGVSFTGDLETAYRICLWSRIANHVLLQLAEFKAEDAEGLYEEVQTIDWPLHLSAKSTFFIDVTGQHSQFNNTLFIAQRAKDAIVDQLRTVTGERPTIDKEQPDVRLHIHAHGTQLSLSLDLSGGSLHRRGYRLDGGIAPLKETLAAAILYRAGWREQLTKGPATLLDPMCGTGTLLGEAILMAFDIAPGLARKHYGFLNWRQHQPAVWQALLTEAQDRKTAGLQRQDVFIYGRDNHPQAIQKSQENIGRLGLSERVQIRLQNCSEVTVPASSSTGLIVCNPPYGERLNPQETEMLDKLFRNFGKRLQQGYMGWKLAIISGAPREQMKAIGIRPLKQYTLLNGTIPCKLFCFEINDEKIMRFETPEQKQQRKLSQLLEQGLSQGAQMFANRLQKNVKHLKKWRQREDIACYRVYDADLPDYAVAIDLYTIRNNPQTDSQIFAHIQEYEPAKFVDPKKADIRRHEILAIVQQELAIPQDRITLKMRKRQRGDSQYERQGETEMFYVMQEGPARYWVNFKDYLDTGVFLDHRQVRQKLAERAAGKTVLNLFAYTCTASVQAVLAGSKRVTSVDLSRTYLNWGMRNFQLNQLSLGRHDFIQADCLTWLEEQTKTYDVIFLNPPTFSNSKRMTTTWDVSRDHVSLIKSAMRCLNPQGCLLFSCNQKNFKLDPQLKALFQCIDISKSTLPMDFLSEANRHHVFEIKHLSG